MQRVLERKWFDHTARYNFALFLALLLALSPSLGETAGQKKTTKKAAKKAVKKTAKKAAKKAARKAVKKAAKKAVKKTAKKAAKKAARKAVKKAAKKAVKKAAKKAVKKAAKKAVKKAAKKAVKYRKESNSAFAHTILLNGGQNERINFYSHVLYLRMMRQVLQELGVEDEHITVIAADGDSPKPDQAILREKRRPEQWLFAYRAEGRFYPRQPSIINTVLKNKKLHVAKRKPIQKLTKRLSEEIGNSKKPLMLFVTDHGTPNRALKHHRNNRISLWNETWSVRQFHKALRTFKKRRVISVMSQCFSGSFMWSVFRKPGRFGVPSGDRCGFYATLPDRPAYGCFPETRLKKQVGHAYRFILAMRNARTFDEAHKEVLLTDLTPDVPHRSSDGYLYAMLQMDAKADGMKVHKLVDQILTKYKDKTYPGMKEDMALISAIATRFGLIRPMDMGGLVKQRKGITKRMRWWERVEGLWRNVYATARNFHLDKVYKAEPTLEKNVRRLRRKPIKFFRKLYQKHKNLRKRKKLMGLKLGAVVPKKTASGKLCAPAPNPKVPQPFAAPAPARVPNVVAPNRPARAPRVRAPKPFPVWPPVKTLTVLRSKFLTYVEARPKLLNRLRMLYLKEREMSGHVFMIKSQLAALKRIEVLYYRIAGRLLVEYDSHPDFRSVREGVKRLIACEKTPLRKDPETFKPKPLEKLNFASKHPPLPSWFGISFRPIPPKRRGALPPGAVMVEAVYLNTPAKAAGMKVGDVVVAVNHEQLREPHEIRERVMLSPAKKPTPMLVLRNNKMVRLQVPLRLQTTPPAMKLPPLLGKVVKEMPTGRLLSSLNTPVPYKAKGTFMLFFWATWCGPCKAALPTMRKWKASYGKLGFKTITISNEKPSTVNAWLKTHAKRMPFINIYDLKRTAIFREFRIQGTPTFILIKDGQVKFVHVGFRKLMGMEKAIAKALKK